MKILLLDLEISPTLATVWGLFNQNIALSQITGNSEVLTWAAKWHDSDEVLYSSRGEVSKRKMIKDIHKLLNEADVVITYNGNSFDLKILNKEFLLLGLAPPAPYKSLDLLTTMRGRFRGTSNKLDYWVRRLDIGQKIQHRGHQLWLDCMNGDKAAFAEMLEYNIQDVVILERLYDKVRPWIKNHPNHALYAGELVCPNCGGAHYQKRGWSYTSSLKYRQYQCREVGCGKWFRSVKAEPRVERFVGVA